MIDFTKSGQQSRHPGVSTSQGLHGNKPGNFFVHQNSTPEEVESLFTEQREQYDNYYEDLIEGNSWKPFYNFGYSPKTNRAAFDVDIPGLIEYDEEDTPWKYQCNLYVHLLELVELSNKNILEIGCGLGHGASVCKKYFPIESITGVDLNEKNISFAKNNFKDINFDVGNVVDLKYPDKSFDIVLSVETSHCYRFVPEYYTEVFRVLKDGGVVIITDIYPYGHDAAAEVWFMQTGFKILKRLDISEHVKNSCDIVDRTFRSKFEDEVSYYSANRFSTWHREKYFKLLTKENSYVSHLISKI